MCGCGRLENRMRADATRRDLGWLLDAGVAAAWCLVIIIGVVRLVRYHRHRTTVRLAAQELHALRSREVALPFEMRQETPLLFRQGIRPYLYEPGATAVQELAVNGIRHVVLPTGPSYEGSLPADLVLQRTRVGRAVLATIDLERAERRPPGPGRSFVREYSRPFIYEPIQDSFDLRPDQGLDASLILSGGKFVLEVAAFSEEQPKPRISVQVMRQGQLINERHWTAHRVVRKPRRVRFEIPSGTYDVEVLIRSTGPAHLHRWEVLRK